MSFTHTGVLRVIETMVAQILQIFRPGSLAYGCTNMPGSFLKVVAGVVGKSMPDGSHILLAIISGEGGLQHFTGRSG
jgi:hypothetical protein